MKPLFGVLPILFSVTSSFASNYYVSNQGSDSNPGSFEQPFKTVKQGLSRANAGDVVFLRGGTYKEEVAFPRSGSAQDGPIVLKNYGEEVAVLDGASITAGKNQEAMILIEDRSFITVEGLTVANYQTSSKSVVPNGIRVEGAGEGITLKNNKVRSIKTNYAKKGGNAHAIAVYGSRAPQSIKNIVITGNELSDLKLGSSEAMVLNGNVENFIISKNYVHHSNNIGIDIIGFEGTAPSSTYDQARNGIIVDNLVHAIATKGNPAYGNGSSAGGIYVDGGRDVLIERNTVYDSDIGIEIASEHKGKSTSRVTIRNNVLYGNRMTGIALGGYDSGRGKTEDCVIVNNTLYQNDTLGDGNGEIYVQYYTYRNIIKNNVMYAGKGNLFLSNRDKSGNVDNVVDSNIYFSSDEKNASFKWKNTTYKGLKELQSKAGIDKLSHFEDPRFVSESAKNFRLASDSTAIDFGENLTESVLGSFDLDGQARVIGPSVDAGAYEFVH